MPTLWDYTGITKLRDAWPKIKANTIAINNQLLAHIAEQEAQNDQSNKVISQRIFKLPVGMSICQSTTGKTVEAIKIDIDAFVAFGYEEITLCVHDRYDNNIWRFSQTVQEIIDVTEYIKSLGMRASVKIHTAAANTMIGNATMPDLAAWQAYHLAFITAIAASTIDVTYVTDFNESPYIVEDAALVTWCNSVIDQLKNVGKAGISFSNFSHLYTCHSSITANLEVFAINTYPMVASTVDIAKNMTVSEIVDSMYYQNYKEYIRKYKKSYPNVEIIISEIGCPYYWENFANAAYTDFGSLTELTDSGGYSTSRYMDAALEILNDCDIDACWFWFEVSSVLSPVSDVLAKWKGEIL